MRMRGWAAAPPVQSAGSWPVMLVRTPSGGASWDEAQLSKVCAPRARAVDQGAVE